MSSHCSVPDPGAEEEGAGVVKVAREGDEAVGEGGQDGEAEQGVRVGMCQMAAVVQLLGLPLLSCYSLDILGQLHGLLLQFPL